MAKARKKGSPKVIAEVELGPAMRTALDVLDYVKELIDRIEPEDDPARLELKARADGLADLCLAKLRGEP